MSKFKFTKDELARFRLIDSNGNLSADYECELISDSEQKPQHYKTDSIDVIDFCKLYDLNFNCGNVVKYVARAGKKDCELTDLLKAKDYICREIKHLETIKNK